MIASLNTISNSTTRERMDPQHRRTHHRYRSSIRSGYQKKCLLDRWFSWGVAQIVWRRFQKRCVVVGGVDETWATDLVDMIAISRENKGNKFIWSIIDVFSKYDWLIPLKNKKVWPCGMPFNQYSRSVCLRSFGQTMAVLQRRRNQLLQKQDIELYSTENEE